MEVTRPHMTQRGQEKWSFNSTAEGNGRGAHKQLGQLTEEGSGGIREDGDTQAARKGPLRTWPHG